MTGFGAALTRWAIVIGLLLGALLPSMSMAHPGAMAQIVLTVMVVALAAVAFVLTVDATTTVAQSVGTGGLAAEMQSAARQCDPDAAGHVRSRAPGQRHPVCC